MSMGFESMDYRTATWAMRGVTAAATFHLAVPARWAKEQMRTMRLRTLAVLVGLSMFAAAFEVGPPPLRRLLVITAVIFLLANALLANDTHEPETEADPEILALIHARIAESDETVCKRLDRLIAELEEIRP